VRANIPGLVKSITNGIVTLFDGVRGGGNYVVQSPAYVSASPLVIDVTRGNWVRLTVTDAVAYSFGVPLFGTAAMPALQLGFELLITIRNTSGGALGAGTFNAIFKTVAGAIPAIATGFNRTFGFVWDGTNWIETEVPAADVAN